MSEAINPFESPLTTNLPVPRGADSDGIIPFASGRTQVVWCVALLSLGNVVDLGTALAIAVVTAASHGPMSDAAYHSLLHVMVFVGIANAARLLLRLAVFVVFLTWVYRVHRNLPARRRRLRFTPGWAIGWFLIPLANLIVPFFGMAEIWRESAPATTERNATKPAVPWLGLWWWADVAAHVVMSYQLAVIFMILIMEKHRLNAAVSFGSELLHPIASALAIVVIRRIDRNQRAKYESIQNEPTIV